MELIDLNKDCLSVICQFLSLVDVQSLRWTCKQMYKLKRPSFRDIFRKKLQVIFTTRPQISKRMDHADQDFKDQEPFLNIQSDQTYINKLTDDFCKALYEKKAFVSGSFILDCLLNTNDHHDIDIYDYTTSIDSRELHYSYHTGGNFSKDDPTDNKLLFTKYLYSAGFKCYDSYRDDDDTKIRNYVYHPIKGKTRESVGEEGREWHSWPDPKYYHSLQIIPMRLSKFTIPQCILATYDLDICKNIFDGKNLYVRSWKKLIYKFDYQKPNTKFFFRLYGSVPNIKPFSERDLKRQNKYIGRGFNIMMHPQYQEIVDEVNTLIGLDEQYHFDLIPMIEDGSINLDKYYLDTEELQSPTQKIREPDCRQIPCLKSKSLPEMPMIENSLINLDIDKIQNPKQQMLIFK